MLLALAELCDCEPERIETMAITNDGQQQDTFTHAILITVHCVRSWD